MPAPPTAPTLSFTGTGTITGTYQAYQRYLDRQGNPGNLSPISAAVRATANSTATYSNLAVPAAANVVRRQILRNTAGQLTTFYITIDTTNLTATSLSESETDPFVSSNPAVPILRSDNSPNANRYYPPPGDRQFAASHIGRLWLAGCPIYSEGAAELTFNSATVRGVATEWAVGFVNRDLYLDNSVYNILAVDPVAQTMTLDRPYAGTTNPYARYSVQASDEERDLLFFSEPGIPEGFALINALSVPSDGEDITGLMPLNSFLYILKRNSLHKFTGQSDPAADGTIFYANNRGCVNCRCWQIVNGTAYLLDEKGIYSFSGGGYETVSERIRLLFAGNNSNYEIQWSSSRFFHSVHDPADGTIRWFVTMGGGYLPMHAICLNYAEGRFWVERFYRPVGCSTLGSRPRTAGVWQSQLQYQVYLGFDHKQVGAFKTSNLDGAAADRAFQGAAVAAGFDTVTLPTGVAVPPNAVVHITKGTGRGQSRRVVAGVGGNRVRVAVPWTVRPDATSRFQVGGVKFQVRTGKLFRDAGEAFNPRRFTMLWKPVTGPAFAALRAYSGWDTAPEAQNFNLAASQRGAISSAEGDAFLPVELHDGRDGPLDEQHPTGVVIFNFGGHHAANSRTAQTMTIDLTGVAGPERFSLRQIDLSGVQGAGADGN